MAYCPKPSWIAPDHHTPFTKEIPERFPVQPHRVISSTRNEEPRRGVCRTSDEFGGLTRDEPSQARQEWTRFDCLWPTIRLMATFEKKHHDGIRLCPSPSGFCNRS